MSDENKIESEDPVIDDNVPVDETDETLPEEETTTVSEDTNDEEFETVGVAGFVAEELLNPLPTANELRDIADLNNPFNKLVERIADGVLRTAKEGKFISSFEIFQDVDVDALTQLFENQGFKVTCKVYTATTANSKGTYKFTLEW